MMIAENTEAVWKGSVFGLKQARNDRVYLPLMNRTVKRAGREKLLEQVRKMDACAVVLAVQPYSKDEEKRNAELLALRENCAWFRARGLLVGTWTWSFMVEGAHDYTPIRTVSGAEVPDEGCPLDAARRRDAALWVGALASCGVDFVLLDDDFRFGFHLGGVGCICKHHLAAMSEILGEELRVEDMPRLLLTGGKNPYRDAWLKVNGIALETFAKALREAVDAVDPTVRLGLCSCMSLWDMDGTDPITVTRILAGNTRPLLRLSGAPYWAVRRSFGMRLEDIIEFARMQSEWMRDSGVEVLSEGDTYPRPRWICPASYLELFDLAMLADGKCDGILKYVFDYRMNGDNETGYVRRHVHNRPLYCAVQDAFSGKTSMGVRVWERQKKFADMTVPACMEGKDRVQYQVFSPAAKLLAQLSVPSTYEGEGLAGIAFGENVRAVPEQARQRGLILDARAAEILDAAGVDVGIRSWHGEEKAVLEYFPSACDFTVTGGEPLTVRSVTLDAYAEVESHYISEKERELTFCDKDALDRYFADASHCRPASYRYENAAGERYFVLLADAYFADPERDRSYLRQRQLQDAVEWLCGEALPVTVSGEPDLYVMTKCNGTHLSVGLWNCSPDPIPALRVQLKDVPQAIRGIGADIVLEEREVLLGELGAFAFVGFEAARKGSDK